MSPPLAVLNVEELHWQSDLGLPNQRRWLNHRNIGGRARWRAEGRECWSLRRTSAVRAGSGGGHIVRYVRTRASNRVPRSSRAENAPGDEQTFWVAPPRGAEGLCGFIGGFEDFGLNGLGVPSQA
jgi:hypothetical protein